MIKATSCLCLMKPEASLHHLGIWAIVAAPAGDALIHGEGLGAKIPDVEGFFRLDHGQRRPGICGAMAVVAGTLRSVLMAAYPGLAKIVHSVGATVGAVRHGRVADRAFTYCGGVSLGIDGLQVIVHLVAVSAGLTGVLGMG